MQDCLRTGSMREKVTVTSLASGAVTSTTEPVWEGGRFALERVTGSTGVGTYRYVYGRMSIVPVLGDGAAIGGAFLECRD